MEISYDNFKKLGNGEIIDLRESYKYLKVHLPSSINVSFDSLIVYPERYLVKNKNYLLVCDSGIKSLKTSEILRKNGYKTYSLKGGFNKVLM